MEEDPLLQQPADRRLGNTNTLPPGPPGAEFDAIDFDTKNAPKSVDKESVSKSSRRRSPSHSPPARRRRSPSRSRRSPSPTRRRRSPSPRRGRYRDYSPDRRRYDGGRLSRRSPDRRGDRRGGRGFRRGRSGSRSRSRSPTPPRRGGGGNRWPRSPKKKPNSPPSSGPGGPPTRAPYGVMPPQLYADSYVTASSGYGPYSVPPPNAAGFAAAVDGAYGMQGPPPAVYGAAYQQPPSWGVSDSFNAPWMPQTVPVAPTPMQAMPPQSPAVTVAVAAPAVVVATGAPPPSQAPPVVAPPLEVLAEAAPGTVEPNPAHDAAVAQEAENQREELKKQRSSYLRKTAALKKELKMLKTQRKDLHTDTAPPSPTTKGFIDENEKLQNQIQKKLNTIENVIDMLTGIIGEENLEKTSETTTSQESDTHSETNMSGRGRPKQTPSRTESKVSAAGGGGDSGTNGGRMKRKRGEGRRGSSAESSSGGGSSSSSEDSSSSSSSSSENEEEEDSSPERLKTKAIESMKARAKEAGRKEGLVKTIKQEKVVEEKKRYNYVFYDPEMHWCQTCNVFPKTAKDFLNHLHTKEHINRETIETPWHLEMVADQYPVYDNAVTKRTPIRGLTFFVPATAWYCKLCSIWMGDLHCASTHLKSQEHSKQYNLFLDKNPHFEVNWLADRQRVLNEKKAAPLPPQITSVSTTASSTATKASKKSKKDEKKSKKRKKKSASKKEKSQKRKKHSKKRKKSTTVAPSSSNTNSSSEDSSTSDAEATSAKSHTAPTKPVVVVKDGLDNPNPAASIRVAMRKQEPHSKVEEEVTSVPPPTPPVLAEAPPSIGRIGKWSSASETVVGKVPPTQAAAVVQQQQQPAAPIVEVAKKEDDAIIQQWNSVQPVISESEKKLLEQLKGKLRNKPREEAPPPAQPPPPVVNAFAADKENRNRSRTRSRSRGRRDGSRRGRVRSRSRSRGRYSRSRSRGRRSRSRGRRSRSRNRSPIGWGGGRRRRSRSLRRRSRSYDRRRRMSSRSRSRSRSGSRNRIEKPIVRQPEFRPRVPEKEKEKEKKSSDSKDKKESHSSASSKKSKNSASGSGGTSATNTSGSAKKLPFIGKMPVFKKQTSGTGENGDKSFDCSGYQMDAQAYAAMQQQQQLSRPHIPTAAQIQMAMMEDVYGNAPPFHPDAAPGMDYDDLMPDPVQFVSLMHTAPPPPPPPPGGDGAPGTEGSGDGDDGGDVDVLPPGIDEVEDPQSVTKPLSEAPPPPPPPPMSESDGQLPKDLEEALNIIFPGEKTSDDEAEEAAKKRLASGETKIIVDTPVMQPEDLAREGIHMVSMEETSLMSMDEGSKLSMNEPLVFNPPSQSVAISVEDSTSQNAADIDLSEIKPPPEQTSTTEKADEAATPPPETASPASNGDARSPPPPDDIPMPVVVATEASTIEEVDTTAALVYDLDDIPQPPDSPTESEKHRRQEELDDLAMLGIDADDLAAQCM